MMNISKITKILSLTFTVAAFLLVSGHMSETFAQDPFVKPSYKKNKSKKRGNRSNRNSNKRTGAKKKPIKVVPKGPVVVVAPSIEARIEYFKRVRQEAAMEGKAIPKVTSVLLVSEMTVSGVFKTPRGYAAIVEATPIKLSYTIYPGEKFFDGQLVAVEQNRLVFRKVTKWSNNKLVSSVENKPLRKFTLQQEIQGTSPVTEQNSEAKQNTNPESAQKDSTNKGNKVVSNEPIVSPLEEMNREQTENQKDSAKSDKPSRDKKGKKRASSRKKRS